jgi:integration host factor subunit beta
MTKVRTWIKQELTKTISRQFRERPEKIEKVVSATFTVLREVIAEADPEIRIEIRDLGVLEVKTTREKLNARNPKTGEKVDDLQEEKLILNHESCCKMRWGNLCRIL